MSFVKRAVPLFEKLASEQGWDKKYKLKVWSHTDPVDGAEAVGFSWFNHLTEADVVMTLSDKWELELRDHDGDGDDVTAPFQAVWSSFIAETDTTLENVVETAMKFCVGYVEDRESAYMEALYAKAGGKEAYEAIHASIVAEVDAQSKK